MTALSAHARETLKDSGLSPARWIEAYGNEGKRTGDKCGCFDDRCIGHDHDEHDECQCLSALIEFYFRDQNAIEDGKAVWTAPLLALLSGEPVDEEAAARKAALWVGSYQGRSTVSHSLTE